MQELSKPGHSTGLRRQIYRIWSEVETFSFFRFTSQKCLVYVKTKFGSNSWPHFCSHKETIVWSDLGVHMSPFQRDSSHLQSSRLLSFDTHLRAFKHAYASRHCSSLLSWPCKTVPSLTGPDYFWRISFFRTNTLGWICSTLKVYDHNLKAHWSVG